ncbi:tRNA1(Val) (adenine(37)-N6)-methyltransferase [Roseovarius sp. 2305UL8-3]|uniref:tRNA1(Val) (adenine(37)-N6)-methyltransferase n=1 Tax=Roseovarius conchicola TaxID=3121636 RepID=UPI003526E6F2
MNDTLTRDAFLGGKLHLWQPKSGYRAGVDPVLLAASVAAKPGQSVLDLGCGVGAAMLCLGARVPGVALTGLELQSDYADLARRNSSEAGIDAEVVTGDLSEMPPHLRQHRFDHVIANPPYFDRGAGTEARDAGRETALGEATPLADWVKAAAKRCAPQGYVNLIHRAERLPDLLAAMNGRLGSIEVLPLIARPGRAARLVLIRARMGGRADFRLHHGMILHDGLAHDGDRENYSATITCVLRDGASLPFPA